MRRHHSIYRHRGLRGPLGRTVFRSFVVAGLATSLLVLPAGGTPLAAAFQAPAEASERARSDCLPTLSRGDRGENVMFLQAKLNQNMLGTPPIAQDGVFGPATERRVRSYQRSTGLAVDGVVGPRTWKKLGGCFE